MPDGLNKLRGAEKEYAEHCTGQ